MTDTFWCDVSTWQRVVGPGYPYPILAFRADWGGGIDGNAAANWAYTREHLRAGIAYTVFVPGQSSAILARVKRLFGGKCPPMLAFMIDVESGAGFAGPGNHSAEANQLADGLAAYAGNRARVIGYANGADWSACWPSRPSWLKRVVAAYGRTDPGAWAWQYYGALDYPTPTGYPTSALPFGNVDHNVCHKPIGDVLADLGLIAPPVAALEDDMPAILLVDPKECARRKIRWPGYFLYTGTISHIPNSGVLAAHRAAGCPAHVITVADYRALGGS